MLLFSNNIALRLEVVDQIQNERDTAPFTCQAYIKCAPVAIHKASMLSFKANTKKNAPMIRIELLSSKSTCIAPYEEASAIIESELLLIKICSCKLFCLVQCSKCHYYALQYLTTIHLLRGCIHHHAFLLQL